MTFTFDIFSGKFSQSPAPMAQLHRLVAALESGGGTVTRNGGMFTVSLPGLDAALLSFLPPTALELLFWDRITLSQDTDGGLRYRIHYWNPAQAGMHVLITAIFALELCFGSSGLSPFQLALQSLLANCLPPLACVLNVHYCAAKAMKRAFGRSG